MTMAMKPGFLRLACAFVLCAALTATGASAQPTAAANGDAKKVLRYSFRIAESSFDPAQITDLYSRTVVASIFEAPLEYEFLARPARMRTNTAAAMPQVSADFKTFTIRIQPGIVFADDPAFKGAKRELTAQDYVYSIKRHFDPRWKSGNLYVLENFKILGLSELRKELIDAKKPFDYDREVEGVRALDRYTLQIKTAVPNPRLLQYFTDASFVGALAREVVEFYGDKIGEHPVGTGPYRITEWRRSSRIVLGRNASYREVRYDERPAESDARLQAVASAFKGKRLPLVDRVEISIIEENQPRWLAFLSGEHDVLEEVPPEFISIATPNGKLAPNLAKQGMQAVRYPRAEVSVSYFGMENPVVGGYEPHKVALRRAMSLAVDVDKEIVVARRGQAIPAQSPIGPGTFGYEPKFKSEMSEYNLSRAKALLDLHGYVDKNGDGWREQPDGSTLLIEYASQPDQQSRELIGLWKKNMDALGVRMDFRIAKWPENLKSSRAGKLMMWGVGWSTTLPDGDTFLALGYGPNKGGANHARFNLPAFNALYVQQRELPDGPERLALMTEAKKLMIAYMPYKSHVHRVWTDLAQPWVQGYHRNISVREFWKYIDIDTQELARRGGAPQ